MKRIVFMFIAVLILTAHAAVAPAQNKPSENSVENQNQSPPAANPIDNISFEITKISKSLQTFNKRIKDLLDQFAAGRAGQLNEKQQKLLLGFEILNRAEQRLEILQKFQIELAEKESSVRNRLAQVEQDARPENVERSISFVGTTKADEAREGRRKAVDAERGSLTSLLAQIRGSLNQTSVEVRAAEAFVLSLRKKILPQIESEVSGL